MSPVRHSETSRLPATTAKRMVAVVLVSFISDLSLAIEFGTTPATTQAYRRAERVTEGAVVNQVVDSGNMQYAVIAGLHTETGIERLVIAYPNEESLRDLIAPSSIIAAGFSSPEEAAADSGASAATVGRQERRQRIACRESDREPGFAEQPRDRGSIFRKLARFIATSYGDIAATVFVVLASKNVVSAVLRMALGSSI